MNASLVSFISSYMQQRRCALSGRRMGIIPIEKTGRLRIGAFRHTAAVRRNLAPSHLTNPPEDDALDSSLLDRGTAGFKARNHDIARNIRVEWGNATSFIRHVALEILLDGCLTHARGPGTQTAFRVDDRIVGKQRER